MNQFAQLLSAERQTAVVLDCCTIIGARNGSAGAVEFRKRIAHRKDVRIIMPSVVVREVCRVGVMSFEQAIALIDTFSEMGQIEYVSCKDGSIKSEAEAMRTKYPYHCHYPDDHYLVIAKRLGASLVTYDRRLKEVAALEGVTACSPEGFRVN